ncbi:MAG: PaaI family thioesterase, partial [Acidimicrobiia bacterium]
MERWLGDGGMPLITRLGAALTAYGEGWAEATWTPTPDACNPAGTVQAGVQAVLLDAAMNFALLAALDRGDRVATLEMKVSNLRAAPGGERLDVRGETVRVGRRVGFVQAWLRTADGADVAHATGTFIVNRRAPSEAWD